MTRVLVVDDEKSIRFTLKELLGDAGYSVDASEDVDTALAVFDDGGIDVVISDIAMPVRTGVDLIQALRDRGSRVPVILITGQPTLETAGAAVRVRAFDYLLKPIRSETLLRVVAAAAEAKMRDDEHERLQAENRTFQAELGRLVEKRTQQLRESEERLRGLAVELTRVEEQERHSLAVYLHDDIGQGLALARMKFALVAEDIECGKRVTEEIEEIRALLDQAIESAQTLTFDLSPPLLHQLGLAAALEWAGEKLSDEHGLEFYFDDDGRKKPLGEDTRAFVFRATRELMTNVVKHGQATRLSATIAVHGDEIRVTVGDNGIGFERSTDGSSRSQGGFGIFSIEQRIEFLGGTLSIRSPADGGTEAVLVIPAETD